MILVPATLRARVRPRPASDAVWAGRGPRRLRGLGALSPPTSKAEEDLVTVYGTVTGGLDYDTAVGGSNFVASIEADIIE